jgi:hypothetical protein
MEWAVILGFLSKALDVLKKIDYRWLIIIFLILVILYLRECRSPETVYVDRYEYVTDTVVEIEPQPYPVEVYKPQYVYKDTGSTKFIYKDVDTMDVLKDYFTRKVVIDTILSDSNGLIVVSDVLHRNAIESRAKAITLNDRTIYVHTVEKYKPRLKVFAGFGLGYGWKDNNPSLSGNIMLLNKKDNAYQLDYDVLNHSVRFSMYWKIRLRN